MEDHRVSAEYKDREHGKPSIIVPPLLLDRCFSQPDLKHQDNEHALITVVHAALHDRDRSQRYGAATVWLVVFKLCSADLSRLLRSEFSDRIVAERKCGLTRADDEKVDGRQCESGGVNSDEVKRGGG